MKIINLIKCSAFIFLLLSCNSEDEGLTEYFWTQDHDNVLWPNKYWFVQYTNSENKRMIVETKLVGDTTMQTGFCSITVDTLIGEIPLARKVFREYEEGTAKPEEWTTTNIYIGQKNRKVYQYENGKLQVIFDFTLHEGERISFAGNMAGDTMEYVVQNVSHVIFPNRMSRRRVIVSEAQQPDSTDVWIEGLGSLKYGLESSFLFDKTLQPELLHCDIKEEYQLPAYEKGMTWEE